MVITLTRTTLSYNTPSGMITYAILIILFSFFYTFVQVNPEKTAENLQKNGSYIPSVRPGRETEKYMSSLLKRLATIGAVFLAFISLAQLRLNSLCTLQARSRLVVHLS